MEKREVSSTNIFVTSMSFGSSALGSMPDTYGYAVEDELALKTLEAILNSPVNLIDTSRNYGMGRSESRIGKAITNKRLGKSNFFVSTKLDRDMRTNIFDAKRVRKSHEESLTALGIDNLPILYLHDPEYAADIKLVRGNQGAIAELFRLKEEGLTKAAGLAMGRLDLMASLLSEWDFDCLITHNRYTLLNRSAGDIIENASRKGISVFNAAPFCGGMLAKGSANFDSYVYQKASPQVLNRVRHLENICGRHGVSLGAAALQFSMRDPRITSTICGVSHPESVRKCIEWASIRIPDSFWDEIDGVEFDLEDPEKDRIYKPE